MRTVGRNLLYSLRVLRNSPGFTAVTVITLALGIGANAAIFSIVYAALLRPLPYNQPDQLFTLGEVRSQQFTTDGANTSNPDFLDWKRMAKSFQSFCAYSGDTFTLQAGGDPRNTFAAQVTPNFFSTLGVKPALGRDFLEPDMQGDTPQVAILGQKLWRTEFAGDASVVGRIIHLDGKPVTVVGVLGELEFAPAGYAQLWVPLHPGPSGMSRRSLRWLNVIGRLAPGLTFEQARAEMNGITAQLARAYPKEDGSISVVMGSLRDRITGKVQPLLLVLLGAVGFVLLITCANIANLLMTRSVGRRKEFAVRAALGASRTNLAWQWLTESLLLSLLGGAAGLMCAKWGVDLLVGAIPVQQLQSMPFLRDAGLHLPVLAFLFGVSVLTGVLFGLAPGLSASQASLNDALKDETRGGTSGAQARLRNALVISEIAISLVLLVGAGLMWKSLRALLGQDPGYDATHVLTFDVNLPDASYPSVKKYPFSSPAAIRFEHTFTERLRNLPGVQGVAMASGIPANGGAGTIRFVEQGRPVVAGQEDEASILTVNVTYFATLKIPLVAGRLFNANDSQDAPQVLIVNRAFASRYFPHEDAVGKLIRFTYNAKEPFRQIVGVAGDTAEEDLAAPHPPLVYYPNDQGPATYLRYMIRTAADPAAFVNTARTALHEMDPQLPMIQPQTLEQVAKDSPSVFLRRYPSFLIAGFATLALILATVGLYGLISYSIAQRTREIGIRVTLGAQRRDILRIVMRQGLTAALTGIAIGVIAGLGLTQLLRKLLFGVQPGDWMTFAGVSIILLLVAAAACVTPAQRALGIDPMAALRHE